MNKLCLKCDVTKPLDSFATDRSRKDGKQNYCKQCNSLYRKGYITFTSRKDRRAQEKPISKTCNFCGETKSLDSFFPHKGSFDGKTYYCRSCMVLNERQRKLYFMQLLGGKCIDCGLQPNDEWPPACFDFHHQDPSVKEGGLAEKIRLKKYDAWVRQELTKCVLLCSNCHRRRHANEKLASLS